VKSLSLSDTQFGLENHQYTVTLTVTNFLGFSSEMATHSFYRGSTPLPILAAKLEGMENGQYYRRTSVTIKASAQFSACDTSRSKIDYTWSEVSRNPDTANPLPTSRLLPNPDLFIPSNMLTAGATYTAKLVGKLFAGTEDEKETDLTMGFLLGCQSLYPQFSQPV
jgi:hypothetical protein